MQLKRERKGHIPTLLLVVYALVLAIAAWVTFLNLNGSFDERHDALAQLSANATAQSTYVRALAPRLVERALARAPQTAGVDFETRFKASFRDAAVQVDEVSSAPTNLFEKIHNNEYDFFSEQGVYTLTVWDINLVVKSGVSEITRTFDVVVKFNEQEVLE